MSSSLDAFVFAPLAPIIFLFIIWFFELVLIENQKRMLDQIEKNHPAFYRLTNFIGVLFQALSQALGFTVTRSGVSEFQLSVEESTVSPKKEQTSGKEWISKAFLFIGPFFIPALFAALSFFLLAQQSFIFNQPAEYSFTTGFTTLAINLTVFLKQLFLTITTLDFFNPFHIIFIVLLILFGLAIRLQFHGKGHTDKTLVDLKSILDLFLQKPLSLITLLCSTFGLYYVSFAFQQNWYLNIFTALGWLALISIAALLLNHLIIFFIKTTDEIQGFWKIIPFLAIPLSYILSRVLITSTNSQGDALGMMILITALITALLWIKSNTNRFKTKRKMKLRRTSDGPRRSLKQ